MSKIIKKIREKCGVKVGLTTLGCGATIFNVAVGNFAGSVIAGVGCFSEASETVKCVRKTISSENSKYNRGRNYDTTRYETFPTQAKCMTSRKNYNYRIESFEDSKWNRKRQIEEAVNRFREIPPNAWTKALNESLKKKPFIDIQSLG